ncbi:MAG: helix-turn-helix transcriptional regulator [Candidatus Pacebacteria bacterium]|nr:helix-turn-helix transcriptional regulator [Candidatus Paceibacterota bacterium]
MNKKHHNDCPVARVATLLSDPWTILIIRDLLKNKMRFSDLERSLEGISSRTLTNKIKHLEEENIIQKNELYYSITKKGSELKNILDSMSACGESRVFKK